MSTRACLRDRLCDPQELAYVSTRACLRDRLCGQQELALSTRACLRGWLCGPQELAYAGDCEKFLFACGHAGDCVKSLVGTLTTVRNSCVPVDTLATVNSTFGCGHAGDCELYRAGDCDKSMFGSVDEGMQEFKLLKNRMGQIDIPHSTRRKHNFTDLPCCDVPLIFLNEGNSNL